MKKNILLLTALIMCFTTNFLPVLASNDNISDVSLSDDANYELISTSISEENPGYTEYIFKDLNESYIKNDNGSTTHHEEYVFFISDTPKTRSSVTEDISRISYALNARIKYDYTNSGSFYRMNYLTISNITVESGCTFQKVFATISNNGQSSSKFYSTQYKSATFTSKSGGTLNGNSSWVMTTSVENNYSQGTGFQATFYIKRGTGNYEGYWNRYF